MSVRKAIFWAHLGVGATIGAVVLLLALTGVLLTYEHQITRAALGGFDIAVRDQPRLTADELARAALDQTAGKAGALLYENDPKAPVAAVTGRHDLLFLDPYSGAVLGDNDTATARFFGTVEALHRWLALPGDGRGIGKAVTGAANLGFLFLLLSGACLWWPKKWSWRLVRPRLLLRRDLPGAKARDYNWHHVFGIWALLPLVLIVVSGVTISYPWAKSAVYGIYGEAAPSGGRTGPGGGATGPVDTTGLQPVLDRAIAFDPDWRQITLEFPKGEGKPKVTAVVDTGTGRQPARQTTLTYNLADATQAAPARQGARSPGQRAWLYLRFLHTGEVYGILGQTVAGLASLAVAVLVWTGLALAWRRLVQPRLRRSAGRPA